MTPVRPVEQVAVRRLPAEVDLVELRVRTHVAADRLAVELRVRTSLAELAEQEALRAQAQVAARPLQSRVAKAAAFLSVAQVVVLVRSVARLEEDQLRPMLDLRCGALRRSRTSASWRERERIRSV